MKIIPLLISLTAIASLSAQATDPKGCKAGIAAANKSVKEIQKAIAKVQKNCMKKPNAVECMNALDQDLANANKALAEASGKGMNGCTPPMGGPE